MDSLDVWFWCWIREFVCVKVGGWGLGRLRVRDTLIEGLEGRCCGYGWFGGSTLGRCLSSTAESRRVLAARCDTLSTVIPVDRIR